MQKLDLHNETGRSMVEMLGVLAIIGVLSVMGIAGYRSAMTKMRSNELLNEASKRAVVVAGQITLGGGNPSLSEFGNNSFAGGAFENKVYGASGTTTWQNAETDKQFTLSITGVEGNICEQMKGAVGDNAVIKHFAPETCDTGNDNNVKLTYNNDLSADGGSGSAESALACEEGVTEAYNGQCVPVCPEGVSRARDGSCSVCDNGNVYLSYNHGTECDTTTPQNMGCTKNSDCDSVEYCKIAAKSGAISGATCEILDAGRETTYKNGSDQKTFLASSDYMTWWAAENWCKAHRKNLVSYSTVRDLFDCLKGFGAGCNWNKLTTGDYWNNGTLPPYAWTGESYDSRRVWVLISAGSFSSDYSRGAREYAVCE